MRISYLLPDLGFTGGSQVLYQFMEKLALRDHEVFLVTPGGRIQWQPGMAELINTHRNASMFESVSGRLFEDMDLEAVNMLARKTLNINSGPMALASLAASALTEGLMKHWIPSDITIATHNFTAQAAFHLMDRTLSFYHIQAYEEPFSNNTCLQKLARMTYFLPLRPLVNSTWLAGRIRDLTGRSCKLLFPGIDTEVFRPSPEHRLKYSEAGEFRVISCYSSVPHKGWNDAVNAMRLASAGSGKKFRWVIFGSKPDPVEGVSLELRGKVFGRDLAKLYSSCHACLIPSWLESFPLPPLEAMACRTAVVTTTPGTEDYVRDGGNALAARPRDIQSLSQALIRVSENPRLCTALTDAGERTAARFNWDNAVKRLEIIFAEAVSDSSNNKFSKFMEELSAGRHTAVAVK